MWSKTLAVLALGRTIAAQSVPTWPSSVDEIEDLMVLQSGYNSRGFADVVTPCTNSPIQGFRVAAGFVRTAFHDVAAFDASAGTGGLDGSIGYELGPPYDVHNAGPAFDATITNAHSYFNSKATISDMIALGVYAAVRSCGGPQIPMRAGRIDATGPGPNSLPDVADSLDTLTGRFAKMGFSPQEMIALVACGHTLGGIHPQLSQNVTGQNDATKAQAQGVLTFDSTDAAYDNKVVTEYLDGSTQNPLVVGRSRSGKDLNSDLRVYSSDGNATVTAMSDPAVYAAQCQNVLTKMIEKVPSNVKLSDIIVPYTVKPGNLNLQVLDSSSLGFSGEIRIRTNDMPGISGVSVVYKDRSGASCDACKISSQYVGGASGFDDNFSFYRFAAKIKSISSFNVVVTTNDGQQRLFDNGGKSFPYSDASFVQVSSSSYDGSNVNVVVAVRADQQGTPAITVTSKPAHQFNQLPQLSKTSLSVSKICSDSNWAYYSGTGSAPQDGKIDVSIGGQIVDGFRDITFGSSGSAPVCGSTTSSTSSSTTTSASSTTLSSSITSSTSSVSSSISSSSSSGSSSQTSSGSSSSSSGSSTLSSTITSSTSSGSTLTTSTKSGSSSSGSSSSSVSGTLTSTQSGSSSTSSSLTSTTGSSTTFDGTLTSSTSSSTSGAVSSTSTGTASGTTTSGSSSIAPTSNTNSASLTSLTSSGSSSFTTMTTSTGSEYVPPFWEPITTTAPSVSGTQWQGLSTTVVTAITTYCPYPTKITTNGHTYTVLAPTMLTITDCPCTITVTGKGSGTSSGDVPTGTYVGPSNGKPSKSNGANAVSSVYQNIQPAPSGGTDGGDENIVGLDLSISISVVQPTITKTIAIIATNVGSSEWKPWTDTASVVATATGAYAKSSQWGAASVPASGTAWGTAWSPQSPSATKSGLVGKFSGAANNVAARGEVVMMGAAAVVGAVALVL